MVLAAKSIEMQVSIRDTGRTTSGTGMGNSTRIAEIFMRVTLKMDSSMDKALNNLRMEANTRAGSPMETSMGRETSHGLIAAGTKETLLMRIWKALERTNGQTEHCMRVSGKKERCMGQELSS